MKFKRMLALLMAFGLVAAACGSSSDENIGHHGSRCRWRHRDHRRN